MIKYIASVFLFVVFAFNVVMAQELTKDPNSILELKSQTLKSESKITDLKMPEASTKSGGIALLLSLVLPGAGHYYEGRMDVGKYFLTAEAASWLGLFGLDLYGNSLREDARKFAVVNAGVNLNGKPDDYYGNVGNYNNIYEYNNAKLQNGQYDQVYDVNTYYWNWNTVNNRTDFDLERRQSERVFNTKVVFSTALIINRLVSGLSALLLANKGTNNVKMNSELLKGKLGYDGVKLNFSKNF
ncbi:hypothetical protein BH10BAC5_BH10BAC5_25170 [soil metagenome]